MRWWPGDSLVIICSCRILIMFVEAGCVADFLSHAFTCFES